MSYIDPNAGIFGDTFVRSVNGEESHVNPMEANLIDNLGPLGEAMTMSMGSGTRNPNDGAPQYFIEYLPSLIGMGYSAYQNNKAAKASDASLAGKMANWKSNIDQLESQADGLMDPNSSYNVNMLNNLKKNNFDQLGFTNMMGDRNSAQGGVSNYSGIGNQVNRANLDKTMSMNMDMSNKVLQSNLDRGIQLQGDVTNQMKAYDQPFAQKHIGDTAGQSIINSQLAGGLGAGATQGLLNLTQNQQAPGTTTFNDGFENTIDQTATPGGGNWWENAAQTLGHMPGPFGNFFQQFGN